MTQVSDVAHGPLGFLKKIVVSVFLFRAGVYCFTLEYFPSFYMSGRGY
jgi:hypothetical protein